MRVIFLPKGIVAALILWAVSLEASAIFLIDYQGLDEEKRKGPPQGYTVLADRTFKVVKQIGNGKPEVRYGYGLQLPLEDVMMSVMPEDWISYIDSRIKFDKLVDWDGQMPWTDILLRVGNNHGLAFLIDWEQSMVQVFQGMDVSKLTDLTSYEVSHPITGDKLYIHKSQKLSNDGLLVIGGKRYQVVMPDNK